MNIKDAQHIKHNDENSVVKITVDETEMFVPIDPDNTHYAEILKQVKEGKLTIKDAD